jgi:DNA polymerase-1
MSMDVHRATAAEVFGVPTSAVSSEQRRYAKVINFGLIYGMSSFGLAKGYVETVFGRRLYLPEINSPNGPRRH